MKGENDKNDPILTWRSVSGSAKRGRHGLKVFIQGKRIEVFLD